MGLVYLPLAGTLRSQSTFYIRSEETQTPLVGATVSIRSYINAEKDFVVTGKGGTFKTNILLPFVVEVRHVGFLTLRTRIDKPGQILYMLPSNEDLNEVVITGQHAPQSAKRSVYSVQSIDRERIVAQGANTLQEVLSYALNLRFSRDNATGRSGLSLQGLGGQYIKVLLDGVPVVGQGGISNDIDLNQMDIQNVERIELVEGPMAVNYGADALAGVVNIITKKDTENRLEVDATLQEETIGNEYSLFENGIHSPSMSIAYKWNENGYTRANGRYFRYGGWRANSVDRAHDWYPKDQYFGGFLTRFERGKIDLYYRLDYLDEAIHVHGAINDNNPLIDPFAIDEEYLTQRQMHQLQGDIRLGSWSLNTVFSYTDYERRKRKFTTNLATGEEHPTASDEQDTLLYQTFFTRQAVNNALSGSWGSLQLGLDGRHETTRGTTLSEGDKTLKDMALFGSVELILGQLKIRPGIRLTRNSIFNTTPTSSVNFSYQPSVRTQLRWSYGRGFRAPSMRELYHEFIDVNHHIIGNTELSPEYSHNFNASIFHQLKATSSELNVNAFYNTITNQITSFTPEGGANQMTTYINQLKYKTMGANMKVTTEREGLFIQSGVSYIGQYQRLSEETDAPSFVFSPEAIVQIRQSSIIKTGIGGAVFYKYTGANKAYLLDENNVPKLRGISGFHTMDITLSKKIQSLKITLGCRNLLDVTYLNNTSRNGVHGGSTQSPVGNGRSYFLILNYQFKQ